MELTWKCMELPWNSIEVHGIPGNSVEFHGIPWGYFTRVIAPKLAHPKILKGSKNVKTSKQYLSLRVLSFSRLIFTGQI